MRNQAVDVVLGQPAAAFEPRQFDHEGAPHDFASQSFDKLACRAARASRGQEVVDDQAPFARFNRIFVDFDAIGAVFKLVLLALDEPGELSLLAGHDHAAVEVMGQRPAGDESPRFDGDHFIDGRVAVMGHEFVDRPLEPPRVLNQGRNVPELNARLREIGDRAYQCFERFHDCGL